MLVSLNPLQIHVLIHPHARLVLPSKKKSVKTKMKLLQKLVNQVG